uniref:tRNA synthetases class I family protein n=1 Tax=Rhizobium rhizogenes TaxID=359 RepID=A0A7S4ZSF1_RHIRH|nr:class I tRNA ligase family protein [Rhizobium rhizogenes]QCL09180.1 tRNA synthetases class I family protein [Rhizobium rhizogenes]QCL09814.1 tRNA synthetases class I family protein [Rhizobium rhizogenes]
MEIRRVTDAALHSAYDVKVGTAIETNASRQAPFIASWVVIEPGRATTPHRHDEFESFLVISGEGQVYGDAGSEFIEVGSLVEFSPFDRHYLTNTSNTDLVLVSLVWRDPYAAAAIAGTPRRSTLAAREFVISAPPTPNGDLHLGHISGPYLGADIRRRYSLMLGINAIHVTGTDDFQSYVGAKAAQLGTTPDHTADQFSARIQGTLQSLGIETAYFNRPLHTQSYCDGVVELFNRLVSSGAIYEASMPALYDAEDDRYLWEFAVSGGCPNCGKTTGGNICEDCGHPNVCTDLANPCSTYSSKEPVVRQTKRMHFRLSQFQNDLVRFHEERASPPKLRAVLEQMIARGLPDVAVTHPSDWGMKTSLPGYDGQVLWAWVEMALGYLVTLNALSADAGTPTNTFPEAEITQFFGFDNSFYYAVLFPALYMALDQAKKPAISFVFNEFYLLDQRKFSTSRNHAVWAHEFVEVQHPDLIRFYLAWTRPETKRTNFGIAHFFEVTKSEIIDWQNWVIDLSARVLKGFHGTVPDSGTWTSSQKVFLAKLQAHIDAIASCYQTATFSPQTAMRLCSELVRATKQFREENVHWAGLPRYFGEFRTAIVLEVTAARLLAMTASPTIPVFCAWIWQSLGDEAGMGEMAWPALPPVPPPGMAMRQLGPLFVETSSRQDTDMIA